MSINSIDWPSSDEYFANSEGINDVFRYPREYLDCIEWGHRDIDAGGDGHILAFLRKQDIAEDMYFVRKATTKPLVPFARGDNGDSLFCFDGEGSGEIFGINLGEKPLQVRSTGWKDFVGFINDYRANEGLAPWTPGT